MHFFVFLGQLATLKNLKISFLKQKLFGVDIFETNIKVKSLY